jgi:Amidohydrolase family
MLRMKHWLKPLIVMVLLVVAVGPDAAQAPPAPGGNIALINGQWFNGRSFERRTLYSVAGRFTSRAPKRIDRTLDLRGNWIVPPFGEAHNHNLFGRMSSAQAQAILARYLADGVFYVKIQGNYPLSEDQRREWPMNRVDGPDVRLGQTFLTASGGHPIRLHEELLLPMYAGLPKEALDGSLYFTIDSEAELEAKWPRILALRPDFIKTNLWHADEFERRKHDPAYFGLRGLDPALLPKIVARAHRAGVAVSAHITNAADFHFAVAAGVDEIVHSGSPSPVNVLDNATVGGKLFTDPQSTSEPFQRALRGAEGTKSDYRPIAAEDAKLAARRGIIVNTTVIMLVMVPEAARAVIRPSVAANLRALRDLGVRLVVGSDNPQDTSLLEFQQLAALGVFDNLEMLRMWAQTTPQAIFPGRRIGELREGYEASFLALEGNPIDNLENVRKIRLRFKQGQQLGPGD